ncbi:MAG: ParA family protein, partial [Mycobacteriaceae bacterium]
MSEDGSGADPPAQAGLTGRPQRPIPEPKPKTVHGPAKVIAMCNQKGGVGKTTSTINLGASLAGYGRRVLLVDLDPQGALSAGLGVPHYELEHTVHNLLVEPRVSIDDVLIHTRVKNLDLVPSNIDLSAAEIQLVNEVGREQSLARALHPVLDRYDYVLIDCQPSLGLLTVNGLACSDGVIIPTECEYFS